jgi:hypothetical protein
MWVQGRGARSPRRFRATSRPRARSSRLWLGMVAVLLIASCGPWTSDMGPAGGADTETIYTGRPGEFYIVDRTRSLCFFYTIIYGRYDFVQINCAELPEAQRYLAVDPRMQGGVSDGADELPPDVYSDAQWAGFRAAFLSVSCLRSERGGVQLGDALAAQGLDEAAYRAMLARASVDAIYWRDLSHEAATRCGEVSVEEIPAATPEAAVETPAS